MNKEKIVFEDYLRKHEYPLHVVHSCSSLVNVHTNLIYCHWHYEIELILVSKGTLIIEINSKVFEVCEGEALIINSGEVHTGYSKTESPCVFDAIIFNQNMFSTPASHLLQNKYIQPLLENKYILPSLIKNEYSWQLFILNQIKQIIYAERKKAFGYELTITTCLFSILSEIVVNKVFLTIVDTTDINQKKLEKFKIIQKYIENNYMNKIFVDDLSIIINMSSDHFYKFFKSFTSKTPTTYINSYRINQCCILLKSTNLSILDISLKCGFENVSFFIKTFKKYTNYTPTQFRKNY